jgi:hypothetical protein
MAKDAPKLEREGWGVASRGAVALAAGFFAVLLLFIGAVGLFYRANTAPPEAPRPSAVPPPRLETAQRRPSGDLPVQAAGPPAPTPRQARAIAEAMRRLAAEGDRGWAPPQKAVVR